MKKITMPKASSQPFPVQSKFPDHYHARGVTSHRLAPFHEAIFKTGHNQYATADAQMSRSFSYKNRIQMSARTLYTKTWGS